MITCPNCQHGNDGRVLVCQYCGAELTPLASAEHLKNEINNIKNELLNLTEKVRVYEKKQEGHKTVVFDYIHRLFHRETVEQAAPVEQLSKAEPASVKETPAESVLNEPVSQIPKAVEKVPAAAPTKAAEDESWKNIISTPDVKRPEKTSTATGIKLSASKAPPPPAGSEVQFGQKWLLILGVVTVIFGVGYFVKYSFDQNWIPPAGRVLMAYSLGMAFVLAGEFFRRKKLPVFGLNMIGGGIAIFYVATYAALNVYTLVDQATTFVIMSVVTVIACILALTYNSVGLVLLGALGGFLTPFLVGFRSIPVENLMTYIAILNVGFLLISFHKKWDILQYVGFTFTWVIYSIWHITSYRADLFEPAIIFVNLFFLIYAFMPFSYFFVKNRQESLGGLPISFLNTLIAFTYNGNMITSLYARETLSIVTFSYSVIFIFMARYLRKRNEANLEPYVLLLSKGLFFLTLSFPLLLSKEWVTLFWGIQAIVMFWVADRIKKGLLVGWALVLFFLTIGKFYFYDWIAFQFDWSSFSYSPNFAGTFPERWATLFFVLAMLWFGSYFMGKIGRWDNVMTDWNFICKTVFVFCFFLSLNMEVGAFFHDYAPDARFAMMSVLWGLYSVALMIFGFAKSSPPLRIVAICLFCLTLVKVFMLDIADVSTPYRIISFIVLGLLLIGASYLYFRFEKKLSAE